MQRLFPSVIRLTDAMLAPMTAASAILLRFLRSRGTENTPVSRWVFQSVGILPIRDHYYEPLFQPKHLRQDLKVERNLPGLDLNLPGQLELLAKFTFQDELLALETARFTEPPFRYFGNRSYGPGDAELLYSIIRLFRPSRIIEIGSGNSTLAAEAAIRQTRNTVSGYACEHICIEPYEAPWLEGAGVTVLRERVEHVPLELFESLRENDMLFVDSSHIIRPQGDVLYEYQEIIPRLRPGVLVHVHDIFTPRDYPKGWVLDAAYLWNEQYLLESFLAFNREFEVVCSLNHLCQRYQSLVSSRFPVYARVAANTEPGAFWMRRTG
jgi:predicted O-methyltransferase YrrM